MTRWLSKAQVMDITRWNVRKVQRKTRSGELKTRPTKHGLKYSSESLPFVFQVQLQKLQQQSAAPPSEPQLPTVWDTHAAPLALPPAESETRIAESAPQKVALSPEEDAQARERYAIVEPLINFEIEQRRTPHGQLQLDLGLVLPDGRKVLSASAMAEYLAHAHRLSQRTIWRWYRAFQKLGLLGLADRTRKDKGSSRFFMQHPAAARLAAYVYLTQRQPMYRAYEALQRDCLLVGAKPGELPSYETVRAYLRSNAISEPMRLMAREGARVYRERCAPYLTRTRTNVGAGEIWVGDHMIHDLFAMNDCFVDVEYGARIRLRFTAFADFRSQHVPRLLVVL